MPAFPVSLPSTLLERRPDVASAERAMASANAQIGVAKAAYFPSLLLAPTFGGYESTMMSTLFAAPSIIWSLGLTMAQTIFDAGRTSANVQFAKAGYSGTLANYRQSVLIAMQETQDAMSNLAQLEAARRRQDEAVKNYDKAYSIGMVRYREGLDNAQTLALIQQNQLQALRVKWQINGSQFLASVSLVKALGGGWQGIALPNPTTPPTAAEIEALQIPNLNGS